MWNKLNLAGRRFGKLTAVRREDGGKWLCRCDCGGETRCTTSNLTRGNSTSCGCHRRKHGLASTPTYRIWLSMRSRCSNPNSTAYSNYGGRGIRVCERWKKFHHFVEDMGLRPDGCDIDRIDNNGHYEPGNCRWVSREINLNNRRNNHNLTWQGQTLSIAAWSRKLGMNERTLTNRIRRGWSIEQAMTAPRHARGKRKSTEN